jgi:hypothetical protein
MDGGTVTITFDEARDIVAASKVVREQYPDDDFVVAEYGWENRELFVVIAGTRYDVTGEGDLDTLTMDAPARTVSKATGELREIFGLIGRDPAPGLREIGNWPPVPEDWRD